MWHLEQVDLSHARPAQRVPAEDDVPGDNLPVQSAHRLKTLKAHHPSAPAVCEPLRNPQEALRFASRGLVIK